MQEGIATPFDKVSVGSGIVDVSVMGSATITIDTSMGSQSLVHRMLFVSTFAVEASTENENTHVTTHASPKQFSGCGWGPEAIRQRATAGTPYDEGRALGATLGGQRTPPSTFYHIPPRWQQCAGRSHLAATQRLKSESHAF